jgi:transcriptional regulator with XRE-family HTH domain
MGHDAGDPLTYAPKAEGGGLVSEDWEAVSRAVAKRRNELGLTQEDLAERSGLSTSTVGPIERGERKHRPGLRTLEALSTGLGWPPQYLDNVLHGRPRQDTDEPATAEATLQSRIESLEQMLRKINVMLEQRLGSVVDVIYNSDTKVDVTIQIKHSRSDQ